jgi:mannosyltransferase
MVLRARHALGAPRCWLPTPGIPAALALIALAILAGALRARALGAPLWMDEGISIGIASHPLGDIPSALRLDGSPPLYYLTLHAWMAVFGSSPSATHALSLTFFALAVPAAVWAAWTPFGPLAGGLAGALIALDPFTVYYADDARMYTLVLLLALLATGSFVRAFALRRRRHVAIFAVLLAALLYTHNWALFYAAATGIALVALLAVSRDRRGPLRDGALAFGGAALLYAPWLPTLAFQAAHTGAPWSTEPGEAELPGALTQILAGKLPEIIVLVVAGAGAIGLVRRGPRRRAALAVLAIASLTLLLAFAWSQLSSPAWAVRYLMIVAAPLVLIVAAGLARAGALGVAAVALALALSWHGHPSHTALMDKSNVAQIAGALGPRLPDGSLVVTTQPEQVPALRYYLGARLRYVTPLGVVSDPQVMDWRDALARLRRASFATVMPRLLRGLRAGARVLFVGPRFARESTAWSRQIVLDTRRWRRALRRRLHVVARAQPMGRSGMSTLAGLVLARPAAGAARDTARGSARAPRRMARSSPRAARSSA